MASASTLLVTCTDDETNELYLRVRLTNATQKQYVTSTTDNDRLWRSKCSVATFHRRFPKLSEHVQMRHLQRIDCKTSCHSRRSNSPTNAIRFIHSIRPTVMQ